MEEYNSRVVASIYYSVVVVVIRIISNKRDGYYLRRGKALFLYFIIQI